MHLWGSAEKFKGPPITGRRTGHEHKMKCKQSLLEFEPGLLIPFPTLCKACIRICFLTRVSCKVHWLNEILSWNVAKHGLFLQHSSPCSHIPFLLLLQCLDPIGQNSHQQQIWSHHMNFLPNNFFSLWTFQSNLVNMHAYVCVCVY